MAFVPMSTLLRSRGSPLGPASLNQIRQNVVEVEALRTIEHLANGKHNARETPWLVGHVNGTSGYMFDTTYGAGTITQPATGTTELSVVSGVIPSVQSPVGALQFDTQTLANVSDADVANTPHIIGVDVMSATAIRTYIKRFTGTLNTPGNTWADVNREHDIAVFAPKVIETAPTFQSYTQWVAGQYLYDLPERWQAIARDQHATKLRIIEHRDDGSHWTPRVAMAQGWIAPTPVGGPFTGYSLLEGDGIASVVRNSVGVVTITTTRSVAATSVAACFPQGRGDSDNEVVVVNCRCTGVNTFVCYIYVFETLKAFWARNDRTFNISIFGSTTT